ncbi:hypothetical protein FXN63_23070 [Pigmentiphaga aceris]|uniref:Polysaccharide biosynthesis enzyme WcbI domain-containing protein n=1 Tax=Pigmentiphaga aceris TaxID=1940612 RepID=A0A5C0B280_9BURK|nr:WcbI family polysaccharide biosynthesis putative acetyltransferase [Pigmentiphaga aceris]QEI08395.1 hypothetical protein FXN63_23070 [Pigmentiphaga aceris]
MPRILVTGYCQAVGLAHALQSLLPDAEVAADAAHASLSPPARQAFAERLRTVDYWFPANYAQVRDWPGFSALVQHTRVVPAPYFWFAGFHPDLCHVRARSTGKLLVPEYNSAIVAWAYRHGVPVDRVPRLFDAEVFAAVGYLDAWDDAVAIMRRDLVALGWRANEADALYLSLKQQGLFMHSINHPTPGVFVELGKLLARRAGLAYDDQRAHGLVDTLATGDNFPVYPELAPLLGVASPGYVWRSGKQRLQGVETFAAFWYGQYAAQTAGPEDLLLEHYARADRLDAIRDTACFAAAMHDRMPTAHARFDEDAYLARYPDVAEAVRRGDFPSGERHYLAFGAREGRIA